MQHRLSAWHNQRASWHEEGGCSCGLDCNNADSKWRLMSKSFSAFIDTVTCGRAEHPGLELPHQPNNPPKLRHLRCCCFKKPNDTTQPAHVTPCRECGWEAKLGPIGTCKAEFTNDACVWKRPTTVVVGKREETRWVDHTGTRKELLSEIKAHTPEFLYHQWVREWAKWQFKLDIATFNSTREILVLTDFAAVYQMSGKDVGTCEHGISCNCLVALVLHSPAPCATAEGPEREVTCDYWRIWSNQKGDANFHQSVMRQIGRHYKQKIPTLRRVKVWSDGQRAQYKVSFVRCF